MCTVAVLNARNIGNADYCRVTDSGTNGQCFGYTLSFKY